MASARVITSDIWADEWFGNLTFMQQALWIGLFSKCADMQGRMRDIPTLIRSQVWPYQDVPIDDINEALAVFDDAHKVYRYEVNGKLYIQLLRWWAYQCTRFAGESAYPPPAGWIDHVNTYVGTTEVKRNWTNPKTHAAQELAYVIPGEIAETQADTNISTESSIDTSTEDGTDPHIHIHIHNQLAAAEPAGESEPKPEYAHAIELLERVIEPTHANVTHLIGMIGKYGLSDVEYALEDTFDHGGKTWAYIETILKRLARASPAQSPPVYADPKHIPYRDDVFGFTGN